MFIYQKKAFTLIELLVVVSIIGILTTLIFANLNAARQRGRDAQRKSDLANIRTALRLYYNDRMSFPTSSTSKKINGCGSLATSTCEWGERWEVDTTIYMNILPQDPLPNQEDYHYLYEVGADGETYTLSCCLENKSDDKGIVTTGCPSGLMYQITQ